MTTGRKMTGLPLPETPREAPPEIHGLVDAIEDSLARGGAMEAAQVLGGTFEYLTRYFAGVAGAVAKHLQLSGDPSVSLDFAEARSQLQHRLNSLGDNATDPLSKLVRGVFYVGATRKAPTPRRHARLLDLGGIPIRGYRNIEEWIAIAPGTGDLANESKANRELLRYLPILKEWLTATATYFLDCQQSPLQWVHPQAVEFSLEVEGLTFKVGPVEMPAPLAGILSGKQLSETMPPEAKPEEAVASEAAVDPVQDSDNPFLMAETSTSGTIVVRPEDNPFWTPPAVEETPVLEASTPLSETVAKGSEEPSPSLDEVEVAPIESSTEPPPEADEDTVSVEVGELETDPGVSNALSVLASDQAPEAVPSLDDNPFAEPPTESVESTVMLRREDFALDFGELAPKPEPEPQTAVATTETEPDAEAVAELSVPISETAEATSPEVPASAPSSSAPALLSGGGAKPARVPPTLNFVKDRQTTPQIAVSPPVQLYPVVTGPPPEFFDEIPVDADYPEVLQTALTDLNGAIEANDSLLICGQMQRCFDVMIQFFAGIAGAILQEIDLDSLADFDIEDGRFDLETKLELVVTALAALEEYWEGHDAATLIWSVFYDTLLPATDPNCAYLHTRLLGVEGRAPETFLEFSELCSVVPGQGALAERSACRETAHRYLPILAFWLENATPLFLESEVDFVEEEGGAALSWAASVSGSTLDGTSSGFWLEVSSQRWNLPRPELAPVFVIGDAPDALLPLIDELNSSLEKKDFARAGLMVRVGLDFLIQYFAGCTAAVWRETGEMSEQAEELYQPDSSLEEKERLLLLSLGSLSADSPVGSSLGKLFSKNSLQYRVLLRRDLPPGMGPVAEWVGRRDEVGETELLVYLPLLRSWLGAANPWFGSGEQLFEDPSEDGRLEGVVAFGDDFLEMVDPEYVIRLAPEVLELLAPLADGEASVEDVVVSPEEQVTGELTTVPSLEVGPPILLGHVNRLLEAGDDRRAANAWVGGAFEYLIQYFAGLCATVLGGSEAPIRAAALSYFNPKASLRERELLLVAGLEVLKETAAGGTQEKIRDIFFAEDGQPLPHTRFLGAAGPGSLDESEMLLSFWCRTRHKAGTLDAEGLDFGLKALTSWLNAAVPFFTICEHYAEDPGADGQEEMVVELTEDYLDMVLPDYAIQVPGRGYFELLYREPEAVAADEAALFFPDDVRPELLGAKATELGGVADGGEELLMGAATVELGGDDFFGGASEYDSSDLFSGTPKPVESRPTVRIESPYARKQQTGTVNLGSAPEPTSGSEPEAAPKDEAEVESEAAERRRRKKRAKRTELGTAVMELYKKERLEKARRRAEARARKEQTEPTKLDYKLTYRGLKNSKQLGGRCHFGLLELRNVGGSEMKGTVEPSHPSVKVQPSRFEGNEVRVTYQIDPSDMPSTGRVGISLNTQDERIELRMERLVPTSWSRERTTSQALGLMSAPAVFYGIYLMYLFGFILGPDLWKAFSLVTPDQALGLGTKVKLWIFAMLALLPGATGVPAAVKELFSRWDFTVQEETRRIVPVLMLLPSLMVALVLYATDLWNVHAPLAVLPTLASKHWLMVLALGLNLLATGLFSTQTTVWWEDNSDGKVARQAFRVFWVVTVALGVVATFFMSVVSG